MKIVCISRQPFTYQKFYLPKCKHYKWYFIVTREPCHVKVVLAHLKRLHMKYEHRYCCWVIVGLLNGTKNLKFKGIFFF